MIVVFLNNKLITCDTILPLLMAAHDHRPEQHVLFYCFDEMTYAAISRNIVLRDGIARIGELRLLGRSRRHGPWSWFRHRIRMFPFAIQLLLIALSRRATFIHFKALNTWPLRLLFLANRRKTILCEPTAVGYTDLELQVSKLIKPRRPALGAPAAGAIIHFSSDWAPLQARGLAHVPRLTLQPPQSLSTWKNYAQERSGRDFQREFDRAALPNGPDIIAYILGWFGPMGFLREPEIMPVLLDETLNILQAEAPSTPIFIKPHVITDRNILDQILEKHPKARVILTDLHPSVLATRAKFFIANYYSTALFSGVFQSVPTIEYSDYSPTALELTAGGSMRPDATDHFINRDPEALRRIVRALMGRPRRRAANSEHESADGATLASFIANPTTFPSTIRTAEQCA